jgi:hypothetical protein
MEQSFVVPTVGGILGLVKRSEVQNVRKGARLNFLNKRTEKMNIMNPVMNNRNGAIHKSDCMEVLSSSAAAQ